MRGLVHPGRVPKHGHGVHELHRACLSPSLRALLGPPLFHEGIDALFELVEVAIERAQAVPANVGELVDDPFGVVGHLRAGRENKRPRSGPS
jgi:hypothetical protein